MFQSAVISEWKCFFCFFKSNSSVTSYGLILIHVCRLYVNIHSQCFVLLVTKTLFIKTLENAIIKLQNISPNGISLKNCCNLWDIIEQEHVEYIPAYCFKRTWTLSFQFDSTSPQSIDTPCWGFQLPENVACVAYTVTMVLSTAKHSLPPIRNGPITVGLFLHTTNE